MFSQTTEYALRATTWLAITPGQLVSTGELAERTRVPMHYLAKVLQQLAAGGLVTGRRGVGGGYKLARPPEDVRLIEVVRCVSPLRRDGVPSSPPAGDHESDALRALDGLMGRIASGVIEQLDDMRLSDLIAGNADEPKVHFPARPAAVALAGPGKAAGHGGAPLGTRAVAQR
jgi:Rrf2 family nitric oxide-sensitive transcriptional repressor